MSGSIKLKHASGNGVIIAAPSSNPAADRTLELPSDADGVLAKTDGSGNLAVTGDLTVGNTTPKISLDDGSGRIVELIGGSTTTGPELRTAYGGDLRFGTNSTERMRVRSAGGLCFNGDFAEANALNDYEEGYWSPTAMDGIPITTNNTGNHPSRRYIKIGKVVFAYFDFTFGNQFNAFGARFGGLPITVASGGGHGANASTNGYTNLQQEYFLHVSGTNPAIFKSNGAQFTHNEVSSKRFAGCLIYSTD